MDFKEWFEEKSGMSQRALARLAKMHPGTIRNLCLGKRPLARIASKLVQATKNFKYPITPDIFKEVRGERKNKKWKKTQKT